MFAIYLYATIWFVFFNRGPASWMENQYFSADNGGKDASKSTSLPVNINLIADNIRLVLVVLGIFSAIISFILYISMQLMKKLMKRMHRINTFIMIQAVCLSILAVGLLFLVHYQINFANVNATNLILDNMPWAYHKRYFVVGLIIIALSFFSFIASFYELNMMLNISNMISFLVVVILIGLAVSNEITSKMIIDQLDIEDKTNLNCYFIIPSFREEVLLRNGCADKYLS